MVCTARALARFWRAPRRSAPQAALVALAFATIACSAPPKAPPPASPVTIGEPVDLDRIEVRINGEGPYRFGIDTGASGDAWITDQLARDLALPGVGSASASDGNEDASRTVDLVRIDRLTVGGIAYQNILAPVLPTVEPRRRGGRRRAPGTVGSLGFQLFRNHLLTLDMPRGEFRVEAGALPPSDGVHILPYQTDRGTPFVPIHVAGRRFDGHLDTGAEGGVLLPRAWAERLPLREEPRRIGRMRTLFSEADVYAASLDGTLRIGPIEVENPRIAFSDLLDHVNLGRDVFAGAVLTFDQRRKRVRIALPEPSSRVAALGFDAAPAYRSAGATEQGTNADQGAGRADGPGRGAPARLDVRPVGPVR